MEHPRIDDENILDRYLAGRLSDGDEASFEEHLFECAECFEKVKWGEELRRGLQAVAAEDAARATAAVGLAVWWRRRSYLGLIGLALGFVLLPLVVWQRIELDQLRASAPVAGIAQPTGDFRVISLGVVREEGVVVDIPVGQEDLLLSLELQTVDADLYRVVLESAATEAPIVLWSADNLEPNLYDTLLIALPSTFLQPGDYRIRVEALASEGASAAGEMMFRILPEAP